MQEWLGLRPRLSHSNNDSVAWLRSQQVKCKRHHHEKPDQGYCPERLIDVTGKDARLVLHHELDAVPRYAALSYCWGPPEDARTQVMLTRESLARRQSGITISEMTAVLRDAKKITHALGIPYLWMDALCIMQDPQDHSDWERQCRQMDKIYGCAEVTLCAAASKSCTEGFLGVAGAEIRLPFQSTRDFHIQGFFHLRQVLEGEAERLFAQRHYDTNYTPWATRGWVFQERILSNAKIVFAPSNLHFACPSEYHMKNLSETIHEIPNRFFHASNMYALGVESSKQMAYDNWHRVLKLYSLSQCLTRSSDLLPAISGLASIFHRHVDDTYLAGHWLGSIHYSLLWARLRRPSDRSMHRGWHFCGDEAPTADRYVVPSWSCIGHSTTYLLFSPGANSKCASEMNDLETKMELAGRNPFGALLNCRLRMRCQTVDLSNYQRRMHLKHGFGWDLSIDRHIRLCQLHFDNDNFRDFTLFDHKTTNRSSNRNIGDSDETECVKSFLLSSKLIALCSFEEEGAHDRSVCGLVVKTVSGRTGTYHRVGAFCPTHVYADTNEDWIYDSNGKVFHDLSSWEKIELI